MPPQTELHRHLDASFRLSTLLELRQERGLEGRSTSLAAFADRVVLRRPMRDLAEVLDRFTLLQAVFDRPEVLRRLALECVEDVAAEGTRVVELRYSPGFVAERHGLDWEECLAAIRAGLALARQRFPEVTVGLICIATRDYGPEEAARTAAFYAAHLDDFVGFDLAGNEIGFESRRFAPVVAPLHALSDPRVRVTVHAGEAAGPDNVWESIELLGARRIGHGVRSLEDPQLLDALVERQICLEVCPTSNWITRCAASLAAHPIRPLVEAGVPVSINTDDPVIFGNTLPGELALCRDEIGLTAAQLQACAEAAWTHRFVRG
jgi:adenosine deaminase